MKKVLETKNQVQLSVNKEGEYEYIVMKKDVHKKYFEVIKRGAGDKWDNFLFWKKISI